MIVPVAAPIVVTLPELDVTEETVWLEEATEKFKYVETVAGDSWIVQVN